VIIAKSAKFLKSSPNFALSDDFGISEVAILGRSNVGKSSLINALTNINSLAKSSARPGKTQLINFFECVFFDTGSETELKFILVDLPGFGYAKVAKSTKDAWQRNLDEFLRKRVNIKLFLHLIDSRQFDMAIDRDVSDYLGSFVRNDQKIANLYTKCDKINQKERAAVLKKDSAALFVSAAKKSGIEAARELIFKGILGD